MTSPELVSAAKWVVRLMVEDGLTYEKLSSLSESDALNMILAYVDEVGRRVVRMQTTLLTNAVAKDAFTRVVLAACRQP